MAMPCTMREKERSRERNGAGMRERERGAEIRWRKGEDVSELYHGWAEERIRGKREENRERERKRPTLPHGMPLMGHLNNYLKF